MIRIWKLRVFAIINIFTNLDRCHFVCTNVITFWFERKNEKERKDCDRLLFKSDDKKNVSKISWGLTHTPESQIVTKNLQSCIPLQTKSKKA